MTAPAPAPPDPKVPTNLDPLARALLDELRGRPEAAAIVIGGGVALQHYLEFRGTVDLDAWWADGVDAAALTVIREALNRVAAAAGTEVAERRFGHSLTLSFDLARGPNKVFSFQIAPRDKALDAPLASAWSPVGIETLRDNLGAKMSALVNRGAPRDFVDIYTVCQHGLATPGICWATWEAKRIESRPDARVQASLNVLEHLARLESRRTLAAIADASERAHATALREWVRHELIPGAT